MKRGQQVVLQPQEWEANKIVKYEVVQTVNMIDPQVRDRLSERAVQVLIGAKVTIRPGKGD